MKDQVDQLLEWATEENRKHDFDKARRILHVAERMIIEKKIFILGLRLRWLG